MKKPILSQSESNSRISDEDIFSEEPIASPINKICSCFSQFHLIYLSNFACPHYLSSLKHAELIHNRKINDLNLEYLTCGIDTDKVIFNVSSYFLSDIKKGFLSWA